MSPSPALPRGTIRFEHVSKDYVLGRPRAHLSAALPFGNGLGRGPKLKALDDVSFEIRPGDAFALIGANGAGKSTALKCLAKVATPTSGVVHAGGRVVPLIELGIGFHPDLTGFENARFAATIAGLRGRAAQQLVDAAVEFSEIERFMDTPVKRYSSGMFARLSFAIAANLPADILIVDEILSVGDVAFQRKCYARLRELRQSGTTLVFVSHNDWVLKETCERGVLLSHGRVLLEAPIEELLVSYHGLVNATGEQRDVSGSSHRIDLRSVDLVPAGVRELRLHEGMQVAVRVDVAADAPSAVVGIAFADGAKRLIWAAYSDEQGLELPAGGSYELRIDVPDISVLPGPCLFEILAFDRTSPVVEASRILEVTVTGEGHNNNWEHGLVDVPTDWTLTETAL